MALTPQTWLPVDLQPQSRPEPLRYGLFNVADPQSLPESAVVDGRTDGNFRDHAFGSGFFYDPAGCGRAHLYPVECEDPPDAKTFDANSGEIAVTPFVVYSTLVCGTPGSRVAYYSGKTRDRLFSTEQEAVEDALWGGGGGNEPQIDTPPAAYGAATDVGSGGVFATIVDAVAALEQHAYRTARYGYHAVLHAQTAVHAYASSQYLVVAAREGYQDAWGVATSDRALRTPLGTRWVFGGGYPGTGPAGEAPGAGQTYIWITGRVSLWRDDIWSPPDPMRSQYDRTNNQLKLIAERRYLATYDCFSAYALVDIPVPAEVAP